MQIFAAVPYFSGTPLEVAVWNGHANVIELLLDTGEPLYPQLQPSFVFVKTPLYWAVAAKS